MRLERVIDELDKIKESVSRRSIEGSDSKPTLTARYVLQKCIVKWIPYCEVDDLVKNILKCNDS